ncbi:MAG: 30S ribosomal protein S2 [Planctomycetes bacterium]|nr:30S ribosomal protein S2 [Planctomycetota bacterium]
METVSVQELIDAGVHFGCRVSRWNPKMAPFIHGRRNLIHIIDLRETLKGILRAQNLLYHLAAEGSAILWVGTKRQVKGVIQEAGEATGMPIVTERWIGGTLTNFSVIRSRLRRLEELEKMEEDGSINNYSKKMISSIRREKRKIVRNLGGIREMGGIPGAMVVVDPAREANAVKEARKMGLVVIGVLDTDCDPSDVDIVIPGNDDALKSVRLMVVQLWKAVEEGKQNHKERMASFGVAEKREDGTVIPGDEPRPTRDNKLPEGVARGGRRDYSTTEEEESASAGSGPGGPGGPGRGRRR